MNHHAHAPLPVQAPTPSPATGSARQFTPIDSVLGKVDAALRAVWGQHVATRPCPRPALEGALLTPEQQRQAAALMRVNHVGEVCAQALYASQALGTRSPALRAQFEAAAQEETDHLAWTEQRLRELNGRPSLLNPLWYAGSFAIGLVAARAGDAVSLGFVVETERQVEQHLDSHLRLLPEGDTASRAIVQQMRDDEVAHAQAALAAGATELPSPVKGLMKAVASVMTRTAHHV